MTSPFCHLDPLEELALEVSSIRTAAKNADAAITRQLMQQFTEDYEDEFPVPPVWERPGR
jgi:hypothetical protein